MEWSTDGARNFLRKILREAPITQLAQGRADISVNKLAEALYAMPKFKVDQDELVSGALAIGPSVLGKIVYHGSPHKFDKFDASKIGTGEGAQAYGHGVYLADSEGVAKQYRKELASEVAIDGRPYFVKGKQVGTTGDPTVDDFLTWHIGDLDAAIAAAKRMGFDEHLPKLEGLKGRVEKKQGGALYKADLPDEWIPKMLDWDKPLSEQPELVNKLASMNEDVAYSVKMGAAGDVSKGGWRGRDLVEMLRDRMNSGGARAEYSKYGGPSSAEFLRAAGIPGIRYLDGGSRGKGQGSYNYVVFPGLEDQVKILERNGQPVNALAEILR